MIVIEIEDENGLVHWVNNHEWPGDEVIAHCGKTFKPKPTFRNVNCPTCLQLEKRLRQAVEAIEVIPVNLNNMGSPN